jgi:hypothetical protein
MSQKVREEMLPRLRERYLGRGREGRTRMINELCEQFGYSRKHAIKLLHARAGWGGDPRVRKGRPPVYGVELVEVLWRVWRAAEQPCGKRLVSLLPLWLGHYEQEFGKLDRETRRQVQRISAAQADRLLARRKAQVRYRGRGGTKPGGLLKHHIPIRTDNWDITRPGYLEADTVAHCGESLAGDFIWSVTYTDLYSGWTSLRAVWNKAAHGIVEATRQVEAALPFSLLGFDCDNGSEFLNWHLVRHFQERPQRVAFTRSRPYHKDDNGHVEQKNWTHVRQLLGYHRLEDRALCAQIDRLYVQWWEPLHNYFCPSAKLVSKERHGAKVRRRHDAPRTPCDRLLNSPDVGRGYQAAVAGKPCSTQPVCSGQESGGGSGRCAPSRSAFQSPYGLLALRARWSYQSHYNHGVMRYESTTPSPPHQLGVIYF